jgi:hypothetical protein
VHPVSSGVQAVKNIQDVERSEDAIMNVGFCFCLKSIHGTLGEKPVNQLILSECNTENSTVDLDASSLDHILGFWTKLDPTQAAESLEQVSFLKQLPERRIFQTLPWRSPFENLTMLCGMSKDTWCATMFV